MTAHRAMIAKVKIAAKELQLDDGTYRAMLERITGKTSAAACTEGELGRVLDELKQKGWRPKAPARAVRPARPSVRQADHPVARKARAMWISLWNLGQVSDPSEAALEAFARRQLGGVRLQWADQGQAYKLIEALKAWAERAGWSQDLAGAPAERHLVLLKLHLLEAQCRALGETIELPRVRIEDLDGLVAQLGERIRARKAGPALQLVAGGRA